MKNKNAVGIVCAIGCEVLYGISYIFTKSATAEVSVLTLLAWRFFFAFAVMNLLVLLRVVKVDFKGKNLLGLLRIGMLFPVIYFVCETVGISMTTASESGTFLACTPVAALLASTLIAKKKPSKIQVTGVCITLAGVIITVLDVGLEASLSVMGYLMLLMGVIAYSVYCVCVEESPEFSGAEVTYAMLAVACVIYAVSALSEAIPSGFGELLTAPLHSPGLIRALLFQGLGCSIGAFFMTNVALGTIGVNRTSSFIGLSTIFSIVTGVFIMKESFTLFQAVGAVVIICGVYTANMKYSNLSSQ